MGKKFKNKPTGERQFSTPEVMRSMLADTSSRPHNLIKRNESEDDVENEIEEETVNVEKRKGIEGLIEIENPNLVMRKNIKAKDIDITKTTELSRREREAIEKQKAQERYKKLQEQGKTEQARIDLERLTLVRQQREEAAKRREEEKATKEQRKAQARK